MKYARYFSEAEFQRLTPACSRENMEQDFLDLMDMVRARAGIPLLMSSAYRSKEWDKAKGRSGNGAHTYGLGVDFVCNNSATRMKIVKAALECGVQRIGIASNFIHIDMGEHVGLPAPCIWTY